LFAELQVVLCESISVVVAVSVRLLTWDPLADATVVPAVSEDSRQDSWRACDRQRRRRWQRRGHRRQ